MTVRTVLSDGHSVLRLVADRVESFDEELMLLATDLAETMFAYDGVGLAAPQVGASIRMIAVYADRGEPPIIMLNPVITAAADTQRSVEGCLSFDKSRWNRPVTRAKRIKVSYQDLDGVHQRMKASGLLAAIVQHEVDHLNGVLFTDYREAA